MAGPLCALKERRSLQPWNGDTRTNDRFGSPLTCFVDLSVEFSLDYNMTVQRIRAFAFSKYNFNKYLLASSVCAFSNIVSLCMPLDIFQNVTTDT